MKNTGIWKAISIMCGLLMAVVLTASVAGTILLVQGTKGNRSEEQADAENAEEPEKKDAEESRLQLDETIQIKKAGEGNTAGEGDDSAEHSYEIIEKDMTWDEARTYCEDQGGYLAAITDEAEYKIVKDMLDKTDLSVVWLGGIDEEENGDFSWVTGEPFTFSDWAPGEPNNDQGIEHYLVMYKVDGSWVWNDAPADANTYYKSNMVGFVCEYDE